MKGLCKAYGENYPAETSMERVEAIPSAHGKARTRFFDDGLGFRALGLGFRVLGFGVFEGMIGQAEGQRRNNPCP